MKTKLDFRNKSIIYYKKNYSSTIKGSRLTHKYFSKCHIQMDIKEKIGIHYVQNKPTFSKGMPHKSLCDNICALPTEDIESPY